MAITLYGVDPSITELRWSRLFNLSTGGTAHTSGLAVTATGATRTVSVATGSAAAAGVLAEVDAAVTKTFSANAGSASTLRIDVVALQIDWSSTQSAGGSIVVVQGTAATNPLVPSLTQTPGVLWQIPLAEVTIPGGATVLDTATHVHNARPVERRMKVDRTTLESGAAMAGGSTIVRNIGTIVVPNPGWRWCPRVFAMMKFINTTTGWGNLSLSINGEAPETAIGRSPAGCDAPATIYYIGNAISGDATLRIRMHPSAMEGLGADALKTTGTYNTFSVEIEPV